jgi:hypothetical protein
VFEKNLAANSFTLEKKSKRVNTVFQIWERRETERCMDEADKLEPLSFKFVKPEGCDYAICKKGTLAGQLKDPNWVNGTGLPVRVSASYCFIKLNEPDPHFEEIYKAIVDYGDTRSMGAPNVNQQLITREIEKCVMFSASC